MMIFFLFSLGRCQIHAGIAMAMRGGPAWLRITSDGVTDEIHLPDRFDAHRFTPERIWGVQRDEYDVASVAWIAVPGGRS